MLNMIHDGWVWLHIAVGSIGTAVFWVAALSKKGGPLHRKAGKLFVWSAYVIAATALVSCTWGLVHTKSFVEGATLSSPQLAQFRLFISLLGVLAFVTCASAILGMRVLWHKNVPDKVLSRPLAVIYWLQGTSSLGLLALGIGYLSTGFLHPLTYAATVLGIVFTLNAIGEYRYAKSPPSAAKAWLAKHIACMLGCGIAFHTALLLAGARRLLEGLLPGALAIAPWILPTIIGMIAITVLTNRYAPTPKARDHEQSLETE